MASVLKTSHQQIGTLLA